MDRESCSEKGQGSGSIRMRFMAWGDISFPSWFRSVPQTQVVTNTRETSSLSTNNLTPLTSIRLFLGIIPFAGVARNDLVEAPPMSKTLTWSWSCD